MPSVLWKALSAARDLGRLQRIASVLIRYGFSDVVRRVGLAGVLEQAGRALHWKAADELARLEPPVRVRRALEDLGPTCIKLGQMLATRLDLFPPEWIAEFEKLQDQAPSVPFEEIQKTTARGPGRGAGRSLFGTGLRPPGRSLHRPGPLRTPAGRERSRRQGAAPRHPAPGGGRPPPPGAPGGHRR